MKNDHFNANPQWANPEWANPEWSSQRWANPDWATGQSTSNWAALSRLFASCASILCLVLIGLTGCALDRSGGQQFDFSNIRFQDEELDEPNLVGPNQPANDTRPSNVGNAAGDPSQRVAKVQVTGNKRLAEHEILRHVRTRPGRYFDPDLMQQDVDELWRQPEIRRVNGPFLERTPQGIVVTIGVVERRYVGKVQFIGNRAIADRKLQTETGIQPGEPLDTHLVRMATQRIVDLYRQRGFPRTQVEIVEGADDDDHNVVFLIHEDKRQKIFRVKFKGNKAASDARLSKFIQAKAGILWLFGGNLDRQKIEEDIHRLTSYYRNLGYFNARIGRELEANKDGGWVTIQYVIDEGPRYRVRNVSFIGNQRYSREELSSPLKLKPKNGNGDRPYFNAAILNQDIQSLTDAYGSQGYVFADVQAETRFLEEPGLIDLVYKIDEGKQYVVGKINVVIDGDYGVTKRQAVLNRIGLRPGDPIDIRKIRAAKDALIRSQIFADGSPGSTGAAPRVSVVPPEGDEGSVRR